jgi:hypothetical protein
VLKVQVYNREIFRPVNLGKPRVGGFTRDLKYAGSGRIGGNDASGVACEPRRPRASCAPVVELQSLKRRPPRIGIAPDSAPRPPTYPVLSSVFTSASFLPSMCYRIRQSSEHVSMNPSPRPRFCECNSGNSCPGHELCQLERQQRKGNSVRNFFLLILNTSSF